MRMVKGLSTWAVRLVAVLAVVLAIVPAGSAQADGGVRPVVGKRCVFTNRTPAPGSTVRTRDVLIAVSGVCNEPVGRVSVFLDGVLRTTEGGGQDEFHFAEFFTALNLSRGFHRVRVVVEDNGSTSWSFFVR